LGGPPGTHAGHASQEHMIKMLNRTQTRLCAGRLPRSRLSSSRPPRQGRPFGTVPSGQTLDTAVTHKGFAPTRKTGGIEELLVTQSDILSHGVHHVNSCIVHSSMSVNAVATSSKSIVKIKSSLLMVNTLVPPLNTLRGVPDICLRPSP